MNNYMKRKVDLLKESIKQLEKELERLEGDMDISPPDRNRELK